jgi:hypothetical protein
VLYLIKKVDTAGDRAQADRLLKRYFSILRSVGRSKQHDELTRLRSEIELQLRDSASGAIHGR